MKITYLKLIHVAGIYVGSGQKEIEIDFKNGKNRIVTIQGRNGGGKTVLLSSLVPFAYPPSIDERSSISYIMIGKDGYKEIHYEDDIHQYILKHYYKATKESHSVKSYFMMDGEELNQNGNVSSFEDLVEMHLGLTKEMIRLMRIGNNVNSFVQLSFARRKDYIGKMIEDLQIHLKIYKTLNEKLKVTKVLMQTNQRNLYNCHITDLVVEENQLKSYQKEIRSYETQRDELIGKIGKIENLMKTHDLNSLEKEYHEAESSLSEFEKVENQIKSSGLINTTLDDLMEERTKRNQERIEIQSKINSYRISIDTTLKQIERLEVTMKKIASDGDLNSLMESITTLRDRLQSVSSVVKSFHPIGNFTSDDLGKVNQRLVGYNQMAHMIYTLGKRPIQVYLKLCKERKNVDQYVKQQLKNGKNGIRKSDLNFLMDQIFGEDQIISPNCDTEYNTCPYYRLSKVVLQDSMEDDHLDEESLRSIQWIASHMDEMLNELDIIRTYPIPGILKEQLTEEAIYKRFSKQLPFFSLSDFEYYQSIQKEYELYTNNRIKLKEYEHQLSIYKKSGIDRNLEEIQEYQKQNQFYQENIQVLLKQKEECLQAEQKIDEQITLVSKYTESKKYRKMFESTLKSTKELLEPLQRASDEKRELEFSLRQMTLVLNQRREMHKELEQKIQKYREYAKEGEKLKKEFDDLSILLKASSTNKGIPLKYMKGYLKKIRSMANQLLGVIYDDFRLEKFHISESAFEIPYQKNGRVIPDVKYASQSELEMATIAISLALAKEASSSYNILLLDEIDSGLDDINRISFLKMVMILMEILHVEQIFIISQNLSSMANIPMDCIRMSDVGFRSRLQNIIYG